MILTCENKNCKSAYQDSKYGKGNRVYNQTKNGGRCTICLNEIKGAVENLEKEKK